MKDDRTPAPAPVVRISQLAEPALHSLLSALGLALERVADGAAIPGSYWGEPEAGVIGGRLFVRRDTPVHSLLHTAAHVLCMDAERRSQLHTDCGSDDAEEIAVCYLQVLLADRLAGYSRERLFADMDAWGYSFRLGSAKAWFEQDAEDARAWLLARGLIECDGTG